MTRALVIGAAGQDGSYLCEQLAAEGVAVHALGRAGLTAPGAQAPQPFSLNDRGMVFEMMGQNAFDQVYYLAAYHHSAEDLNAASDIVRRSFAVHVDGLIHVLDAIVAAALPTRLFYAASSHVFGVVSSEPQDEQTPMNPFCAYGISKAAGVRLCGLYRQNHGVQACAGILYNHESPRRELKFLSRKVARAAAEIKLGRRDTVHLGNLAARLDWGYAPEYTVAMRRILELEQGGDFIIASGRPSTVQEFVEAVFNCVRLDWRKHVSTDPTILLKGGRGPLVGNPAKLQRLTGWSAQTDVGALALLMVNAELAALA